MSKAFMVMFEEKYSVLCSCEMGSNLGGWVFVVRTTQYGLLLDHLKGAM